MESDWTGPVNIGSEEMVSINEFVDLIADVSGKEIHKNHIEGPQGVRGRNSDNALIHEKLGWKPTQPLREGIAATYAWIEEQVATAAS
jgi:GDP-D-mannose 3',5'-epimerase